MNVWNQQQEAVEFLPDSQTAKLDIFIGPTDFFTAHVRRTFEMTVIRVEMNREVCCCYL